MNWAPSASPHTVGLGIRSWESILTYGRLLHTYGTHANTSVLPGQSYAMMRIASSSEPRRSSGRPRHQECGIVPCLSRRVDNGTASNHPHTTRQSHTRPGGRWLPSHHGSRYGLRCESRKSPLRRVNKANQATLGHSMEHGSALHHAKVKEPLPLAALHLQPP